MRVKTCLKCKKNVEVYIDCCDCRSSSFSEPFDIKEKENKVVKEQKSINDNKKNEE